MGELLFELEPKSDFSKDRKIQLEESIYEKDQYYIAIGTENSRKGVFIDQSEVRKIVKNLVRILVDTQ